MWQTGTTDNYLTALQALIDVATSDHVATVAVNAGGTGYVVGDVLTVAGGTSTYAATLLVTSVAAGVIDGVRVQNGGAYTADPTLTANTATGGTGTGASFDLTMSGTGWTVDRRRYRAARATITAGGTNYAAGQFLTVSGGTADQAAVFRIASVSGGAVTSVVPVDPDNTASDTEATGKYTVTPANPASTTVNTGSGSGCTLTIQYEQELELEGSGTGAQDISVGIKTYQTTDTSGFNTTYNWALFAKTSYSSALDFFEQPGISPGFAASPPGDPNLQTTQGAFVPLRDTNGSFPITFWFNFTPQRLVAVFKVEGGTTTIYASMYLGYLNPLGTTTELPFPMYVAGSSHRKNVYYEDATPWITGLTQMAGGGGDAGPGFLYRPSTAEWQGVDNSDVAEAGTSRLASTDNGVYPGGDINLQAQPSGFQPIVADGWGSWEDAIPEDGVPGTAAWALYPTPNTGGDLYHLIPATVADADDNANIWLPYGELDDVFWVGRATVLTSEDTITVGSDVYRVFQNGNRQEEWSYMAIKETF